MGLFLLLSWLCEIVINTYRYMKRSAYSFQPQLKVDCYHVPEAPRLYVKKVTLHDLIHRWIPHHPKTNLDQDDAYYVECQKGGHIDWKNANVYTARQLVGRNNVFVIRFHHF